MHVAPADFALRAMPGEGQQRRAAKEGLGVNDVEI